MKLTDQDILNYYVLRMNSPRLKIYSGVDKLIGNLGKLKVTRTYTLRNDDGTFADKTIESYLLVKGFDRNNMIATDGVPYLDLFVEDGVIKAKDVEEIFFDGFGNKYIKNPGIQLDDKEISRD